MATSKRKHQRRRKRESPESRARRAPSAADREAGKQLAEARRYWQELFAPGTAPERVAELLVEAVTELPAPAGLVERLGADDPEHARAVARAIASLAPGSVLALTFESELALTVDGDRARADALLDEALDADMDAAGDVLLGRLMVLADRAIDALEQVEPDLMEDPGDERAQTVQALALAQLHARRESGARLTDPEREALEHFSDRSIVYDLREALTAYIDQRPELAPRLTYATEMWVAELDEDPIEEQMLDPFAGGGSDRDDDRRTREEVLRRMAIEYAWIIDDRDEDEDEDGQEERATALERPEPVNRMLGELANPGPAAPILQHFASDATTAPALSVAASEWLESFSYGLWQIADPVPSPGVWLTDLASGVRRYAAVASEQLAHARRWSVMAGGLVALDGIWRTTSTLIPLRPSEADQATQLVRDATDALADELTGKRRRAKRRRSESFEPHGVLIEELGPAPPEIAHLISTVLAVMLPTIAAGVWGQRAAGPRLANSDGHRTVLITATIAVQGAAGAPARLAAHPDFLVQDGQLTWWGRELTVAERESAIAEARAQLGDAAVPSEGERPRWLRGRLTPVKEGFTVEVNSQERLEMLLELLTEHGYAPTLRRRSAIDPDVGRASINLGSGSFPFDASQDVIDAWTEHWLQQRVPALGGLTPRAAAAQPKQRARLESLLREFEHDADTLVRAGRPAPNLAQLRAELGMERS